MRKRAKILALVLLLILTLSGCLKVDMSVRLNSDETGSLTAQFAISKEAYDYLKSFDSSGDPFDGQEYFEIVEDGVTYVAFKETKENLTFDEIAKYLVEGGEEDKEALTGSDSLFESVEITKTSGFLSNEYSFVASTIRVQKDTDDADNGLGDIGADLDGFGNSLAESLSKFTLTIEMPGKISHNSNGKVEGNKVVFTISDFTQGNILSVHSKDGLTSTYIYIGFAAILLILIAIFIIRRIIANRAY